MKIYVISNTQNGTTNTVDYEIREDDSTPVSGTLSRGFNADDLDGIKAVLFDEAKRFEAALEAVAALQSKVNASYSIPGSTNKVRIVSVVRRAGTDIVDLEWALLNASNAVLYGPTTKGYPAYGLTFQKIRNDAQEFNERWEVAADAATKLALAVGTEVAVE